MKLRHAPTAEQPPIIRIKVDFILVQAFAGAGKTSISHHGPRASSYDD